MKILKFNVLVLMVFVLLTSFGFSKTIDNNAETIFTNCLIYHYDGKTFIIGYDYKNTRIIDGLKSYDAMIYRLEGNEFIPVSKPFGITNDDTITDGLRLNKYQNNKMGGGSSSVLVLDDGYVLLTFSNINLYKGNNSNVLLLKYDNGNWIINKYYKFNSRYPLLIEQYYFNPKNKDRSVMIYSNMGDIRIDLIKNSQGYNFDLVKGDPILPTIKNALTSQPNDTFTDIRDGNVYNTVTIGDQEWMAENLKYLPSFKEPPSGASAVGLYYYVYGYDGTSIADAKATENYGTYGVLYNWRAAQDACPDGWHLPSDEEWEQLTVYLGDNGYNYDGSTGGGRLKIGKAMASSIGWESSTPTAAIGNTDYSEYRNKSGFTALPGGGRGPFGTFSRIGYNGYWWSATTSGSGVAWTRYMDYHNSNVSVGIVKFEAGFSVRCVRD